MDLFEEKREYSEVSSIVPEIYISRCGEEWESIQKSA
jgi:hypothetical protein